MNIFIRALSVAILIIPISSSAENHLSQPESVTFDTLQSRWLVSNIGDGNIIEIDSQGNQNILISMPGRAYGNCIVNDIFYVSRGTLLYGYDLVGDSEVVSLPLPAINSLDGMDADTSGFLYIVDTGGRILKVDLSNYTFSLFVSSGMASSTQDCIFDRAHNRLLIAGYSMNAPVQAVNLEDSTISNLIFTAEGYFDGITIDQYGYVYLSATQTGQIIRYDSAFQEKMVFSSGITWPAGIHYNQRDHILGIPDFYADDVKLVVDVYHNDDDDDGIVDIDDNCPYEPNPEQEDFDNDNHGDVCDNCPLLFNANQSDDDNDEVGNLCDNCQDHANPLQEDADSDLVGDSCDNCIDVSNPDQADSDGDGIGNACEYICGDSNKDLLVNVSDAVHIINFIFLGGEAPDPFKAGDVNCDSIVNISDAVWIINHIFIGGNHPCDLDGDSIKDC